MSYPSERVQACHTQVLTYSENIVTKCNLATVMLFQVKSKQSLIMTTDKHLSVSQTLSYTIKTFVKLTNNWLPQFHFFFSLFKDPEARRGRTVLDIAC